MSAALLLSSMLLAGSLGAAPPALDLAGVVKGDLASALPAPARQALARDRSVRLAGRERQFFALYDRNAYEGVPSFVSLDVALHLFHARVDRLISASETTVAAPALKDFAGAQALAAAKSLPEPRRALAVLYHAIPFVLAGGEESSLGLEKPLADRLHAAVETLRNRQGALEPGLCQRPLDLSCFKPRGHYTRALQGYFLAYTFYAQCGFALDTREGLVRAADLTRLAGASSRALLAKVRAVADVVAGPPDDIDLSALTPLLAQAPALPADLSPAALASLQTAVGRLPLGKVPAQAAPAEPFRHVFHLLGGAAELDALLFTSATTKSGQLPSVLSLLASLGSDDARKLLGAAAAEPASPEVKEARTLFARWLEVLRLVVKRPGEDHPGFEKSDAWARHLTVAAAGSWAELRHDTLLYVKVPIVWREGGHVEELPAAKAAGYVEPRPEVWRALAVLVTDLATHLGADAGRPEPKALLDLLKFLTEVSELELAQKPFPPAVDERLRGIGGEMEAITRGRDDELAPQALVCDVFDLVSEDGAKQILEVGIGDVDELYVIVPRAGKQLLARGGAFSYYEFPSAERLDDALFRALLDDGKAPRPAWAAPAGKAPPAMHAPPPERRRTRD